MTTKRKTLDSKTQRLIDECAKKISSTKEYSYFRFLLTEMVSNHTIPIDLLAHIPLSASKAGKTRFDQLYDASMGLAFPGYREETLERLLGPNPDLDKKVWRIMLPPKFRVSHVLIRAYTFQEAFSYGCDYACRASLRMFGSIPADLTIRVAFVSERSIRRMLDMRWANKTHRRKQLKLVGREYTDKQIHGARLIALGHPDNKLTSIVRYTEKKDLDKVRDRKGLSRVSVIENESYRLDKDYEL